MVKPEKSDHPRLVYHFTILLIKFVPPLSGYRNKEKAMVDKEHQLKCFKKEALKKLKLCWPILMGLSTVFDITISNISKTISLVFIKMSTILFHLEFTKEDLM